MRCPTCGDEYEDGVTSCVTCRVPLVPAGSEVALPAPVADTRLGTFHPQAVGLVTALCERRGVACQTRTADAGVEVLIDRAWRNDLRAELTLRWADLVRQLDEEVRAEVIGAGGSSPGWVDAPQGGHIDRAGRLVVSTDADEAEDDAARVVGPAMLTVGAVLAVVGWFLLDSGPVAVAGVALAITGLILPR